MYYHLIRNNRHEGFITENDFVVPFETPGLTFNEREQLENAGDYTHFSVIPLLELLRGEPEEPELDHTHELPDSVYQLAQNNGVDLDKVIGAYVRQLEKIYDDRTAGDYTFMGVLASFVLTLEGVCKELS